MRTSNVKKMKKEKVEYLKYYGFEIRNKVLRRQTNVSNEYVLNRSGEFIVENPIIKVGKYTFSRCSHIESVILPIGITEIDDNAFSDCSSLYELRFILSERKSTSVQDKNEENSNSLIRGFEEENKNALIYEYKKSIIREPYEKYVLKNKRYDFNLSLENTVLIPKEVKRIGKGAFKNCVNIKNLIFEEGIETIEENAFFGCTGLESVVFPSTLIKIGNNAFENCNHLENVVFSEGIKYIGEKAFYDCFRIKNISQLPSSLEYVGYMGLYFPACMFKTTLPPLFDTADFKWFLERFQRCGDYEYLSVFSQKKDDWNFIRNSYLRKRSSGNPPIHYCGGYKEYLYDRIKNLDNLYNRIKILDNLSESLRKMERFLEKNIPDIFEEKKRASELFIIKYKFETKKSLKELCGKTNKTKEKHKKEKKKVQIDALNEKYTSAKPPIEESIEEETENIINSNFIFLFLVSLKCFEEKSIFRKSIFSYQDKFVSALKEVDSKEIYKLFIKEYIKYAEAYSEDEIIKLSRSEYEKILESANEFNDAEIISKAIELGKYAENGFYFPF